jgi:signal transduction histidine kinase
LEIIDNGCGMDEKTLSRIFEVFWSTKTSGSGLGLPTVKRIVEAHGGQLLVDSAPSRGTRFTISLPPADVQ